MSSDLPHLVIPGDIPTQIADSPQLNRLADRVRLTIHRDWPRDEAEQVERVRDADLMINSRGNMHWRRPQMEQLTNLKMLSSCSIGTDSIDLEAASELGIVVSNIPGRTAPIVAEHALAMILGVAKRICFQTSELRQGNWVRRDNLYLHGATLGVVGAGAIGAHVIRLAKAIGMRVIAWTFHPESERAETLGVEFVSLDELLAQSDVVSLHVRLSPDTKGMIGADELQKMKPGAMLVNTARGPVVDTQALADALHSGHLGGAAVDVFDQEPIPTDHPLLGCEQVVLTPHSADHTPEGMEALNAGAVDNILAFLDGAPTHVVTQSPADRS